MLYLLYHMTCTKTTTDIQTVYGRLEMKEGGYVPAPHADFSSSDPFLPLVQKKAQVRDIAFDETYPYLDDSRDYRWQQFKCYAGLWSFALMVNRILYGCRVKGRKNLRENRKLLKEGAVTVCNHVYRWDMLCVLDAIKYRRSVIPMMNKHFLGGDFWFLRSIGGLPLPETAGGLKKFNEAFDEYHRRKRWIHVFAESCRWEFYTPIRPLKIGAFNMAWKYNIPVIPLAISYRERKGIYKLFGKEDTPLVTISIGKPILPDKTISRKVNTEKMRSETHAQMVSLAGISNNPWPAAID